MLKRDRLWEYPLPCPRRHTADDVRTAHENGGGYHRKGGRTDRNFQKIPAGADIADANFPGGGNMVISGSRESMNSEVTAMRTRSLEILKSIDYHRTVVESCNRMMETLNPELAERQRQDAENKALRQEISELKAMMAELLKPAEKASSNNSKKQQT